jgi:hypothetical protein
MQMQRGCRVRESQPSKMRTKSNRRSACVEQATGTRLQSRPSPTEMPGVRKRCTQVQGDPLVKLAAANQGGAARQPGIVVRTWIQGYHLRSRVGNQ